MPSSTVRAPQEVVDLLRQRSRPYLFSNTVSPTVVAASHAALDLVAEGGEERAMLVRSTERFRRLMSEAGFDVLEGDHPITPVMFGDARTAGAVAEAMLDLGVYVVAGPTPSSPAARPGSASRSPPRTPTTTSTGASPRSWRRGRA